MIGALSAKKNVSLHRSRYRAYFVFMSGEVNDEHVCPRYRTGEDPGLGVESLPGVGLDPVVLEDLLPAPVVVTVSAAVEEY